jgi:hypothetical protein
MASVSSSTPDPFVGEECLQVDLDTVVRVDARGLDPMAARTLLEVVAATWEVYRLREILSTASWVPGYFEKPITQKKLSHTCLIIEILPRIQNISLIYMQLVDVWGRWITRCGGMRKRQRTVRSVPLLQEVIKYAFEQYCYKIGKIAYLKIVTYIIEMMYCWLCIRFWIISL